MTKPAKSGLKSLANAAPEAAGQDGAAPVIAAPPPAPKYGRNASLLGLAAASSILERERAIEFAPDLFDPSPVQDRLGHDEKALALLMDSIRENGQVSPILATPSPIHPGRYRVVYGHRRLEAIKRLVAEPAKTDENGHPILYPKKPKAVLAVIRDYATEAEAVQVQAAENRGREDLTWIERALFLVAIEDLGVKAPASYNALGTDKSEASRMRGVVQTLPRDLILSVGSHKNLSSRRWVDLRKAWEADNGLASDRWRQLAAAFPAGWSDWNPLRRFETVLARIEGRAGNLQGAGVDGAAPETRRSKDRLTVTAPAHHAEFVTWLEGQVPDLWRNYLATR